MHYTHDVTAYHLKTGLCKNIIIVLSSSLYLFYYTYFIYCISFIYFLSFLVLSKTSYFTSLSFNFSVSHSTLPIVLTLILQDNEWNMKDKFEKKSYVPSAPRKYDSIANNVYCLIPDHHDEFL